MGVYERIYCFNSKWVRKKQKYANSKWIFRNPFCCCSYLSIDAIISLRLGLKTGMDFMGQVWKWVWNMTYFWSEVGSGFRETGGTPPPRIPRHTSPDFCLPGATVTDWKIIFFKVQVVCRIPLAYDSCKWPGLLGSSLQFAIARADHYLLGFHNLAGLNQYRYLGKQQ